MHFIVFLEADTDGRNFLVVHSKQRTRTDDVKAAIQLEKLERRGAIGTLLHFVEQDERIVRNELPIRIQERNFSDNRVRFEALLENSLVLGFLDKVYRDETLVVLRKMRNGRSFSDLPSTLYNERQMVGICLPIDQKRVQLSSESVFHTQKYRLFLVKNHIFPAVSMYFATKISN